LAQLSEMKLRIRHILLLAVKAEFIFRKKAILKVDVTFQNIFSMNLLNEKIFPDFYCFYHIEFLLPNHHQP
jgi:hypothetical protein